MGWVIRILLTAFVAVSVGSILPVPAAAAEPARPSFDCLLTKDLIERTICDNSVLAEQDALMSQLYAATRTSALGQGPSNELAAQREWLKNRSSCRALDRSTKPSRVECLREAPDKDRNQGLAVAALFTEPALARETLRRIDPEGAPLYEALVGYVNAPEETNWATAPQRPQMIRLLQPYFDRFATDGDLTYGHDILTSAKILTPLRCAEIGRNFVQFPQVASAYSGAQTDPAPRSPVPEHHPAAQEC